MGSLDQFALFREMVLADPGLEQRLQSRPDWPSFVAEAIAAAGERDVALAEAHLLAARDQARRSWLERWV